MSETGLALINPQHAIRPGALGTSASGARVRVVDADGIEISDGSLGDVSVHRPALCIGYWKDPHAFREELRDRWIYTGDLARRDADGYYWFAGRKKEIIVRGGSNIAPQEVEEAIYHHPAVREAAVVGMPDALVGERVVAFVVLRDGCIATEDELKTLARQRLADYKVPETIVFLS